MKKGGIWIMTGLLLIAAALCLTGYNLWDSQRAGRASETVLEQLIPCIPDDPIPPQGRPVSTIPDTEDGREIAMRSGEIEYPDYVLSPDMEMPTQQIDGTSYIGILRAAALALELPVIENWSYPALSQAPCRYSGSAYRNDLVICGHNYDTHFGQVSGLRFGDVVTFTDMDGNEFEYEVIEVETLEPTAIEQMTTGDWDLTLFTCTVGGRSRVAVRCAAK